jgi:hypothetical protein
MAVLFPIRHELPHTASAMDGEGLHLRSWLEMKLNLASGRNEREPPTMDIRMSVVDYAVFEPFLDVETWHSSHPMDDRRFFLALYAVVKRAEFSPQAMGDYFRQRKGEHSDEHHLSRRIDDLVSKAWAVRDFIDATRDLQS